MNFIKYRQEVELLYHEYLKLWQELGGEFPIKLPGIWRSEYESFELIVDLTATEEVILSGIEGLKDKIFQARDAKLKRLEKAYPDKAVVNKPPSRSDGKRASYLKTIEIAEKALEVYLQRNDSNHSIASAVFAFKNTASENDCKNAERKVRSYLAHAKTLIRAAGNGTFDSAITSPLPKK